MAFAGTAAAEPFDKDFAGCTGQRDGAYCWHNEFGVIQHLNLHTGA